MYRSIYCLVFIVLMNGLSYAQKNPIADGTKKIALPLIYLPENLSVHFLSPEPIQYVDISTRDIIGDLPLKNILRIKCRDSLINDIDAVVTIVGEKFIAQYHVVTAGPVIERDALAEIEIKPSDTRPLDISGIGFSGVQLKKIALQIISGRPGRAVEQQEAFGINARVNAIYTSGDYIFLDLSFLNKTNLRYDIEGVRFQINDKKVHKASNIQSVAVLPEFALSDNTSFKRHYRNIYAFRKMSFPGNKVLHIELSEKQISGRVVILDISYQDILDADIVQF